MNTRPVSVQPPAADDSPEALLSAMADGDGAALERGCELWRSDPQARATWHTYHLIGDVLRSDDLACRPARDAAFLAALRTRLADEPPIVAPAPLAAPVAPRRRQRWLVPAAAAAGFVAVAGVMVVARMPDGGAGATLAVGPGVTGGALPVVQREPRVAVPRQALRVDEGKLIRDPQLDAYLEAHGQAFSGGRSAALPGGVPRTPGSPLPVSAEQVTR